MSHTPGPWHIESPRPYTTEVRDGSGYFVAAVSEENARLIAAAPELLEALGGGTFSLDYDEEQHDYVLHYCASYEAAETIKAAIAKAEASNDND